VQQENHTFESFSTRTEALADALGLKLSDLPDLIGISKAMFHSYRSGKYPISDKAWRKLRTAEASIPEKSDLACNDHRCASLAKEPDPVYAVKPRTIEDRLETVENLLKELLTRVKDQP
jgi:hypothetical protein